MAGDGPKSDLCCRFVETKSTCESPKEKQFSKIHGSKYEGDFGLVQQIPRKSKDQTLPIGSRESFTWITLKTILCLVLDFQGI